jgi:hypothetical protein
VEDKAAPGIVVNNWSDLEDYKWLNPEFDIYCSERVNFVSEWRCFMIYGQLGDICFNYGDKSVECDHSVINAAIRAYPGMPAGCALDFGVTDDGRTLLVEMNDGYSLYHLQLWTCSIFSPPPLARGNLSCRLVSSGFHPKR